MPRLTKAKNNAKTHRLSIEDEYIDWCNWDKDEFLTIECDEHIRNSDQKAERCLILRAMSRSK